MFSPRDTLCVWAGPPQHDSGTSDVMIKARPRAPLGKAHLWLGWLGGGGCSRVWSSEALAPGCLFAAGIVSACSESHACARMSISFMPSSLVECTGTSARPPPTPLPPSMDPEKWEALGHGHCIQNALPLTFLTYPARQEAFRRIWCFLSVFSPFQPLPCFPTLAVFRQGGCLFLIKASRAAGSLFGIEQWLPYGSNTWV